MPALPKVPKGFITNFPGAVPDSVGPRQFIFLLSIVTVLFVVVLFFFDNFPIRNFSNQIALDPDSKITFSNRFDEKRFYELINLANNAPNDEEAVNNFVKAFLTLSTDYNLKPTTQKRAVLQELHSHLEKQYPQKLAEVKITVPCREVLCGAVFDYSEELLKLKQDITVNSSIDEEQKTAVLFDLENVALSKGKNDKNGEFNNLANVFYSLRDIWLGTKDESTKTMAQQTLVIMESSQPNLYKLDVESNSFNL